MDFSEEINQLKSQLKDIVARLETLEKTTSSKSQYSTSNTTSSSTTGSAPKSKFDHKVYLSTKSSHHLVVGNTYNIRSLLKEKGAKWDGDGKCWKIPEDNISFSDLEELISGQGLTVEGGSNSGGDKTKPKTKKKVKATTSVKPKSKPEKKVTREKADSNSSGFAMLSDSDSD